MHAGRAADQLRTANNNRQDCVRPTGSILRPAAVSGPAGPARPGPGLAGLQVADSGTPVEQTALIYSTSCGSIHRGAAASLGATAAEPQGAATRRAQSLPSGPRLTIGLGKHRKVLVKSDTTAYREAKVQSVTSLIQLQRHRPRPPPSPQGVGSSFLFVVPADHMLKYSQLSRVLPCEVKSSLRVTVLLMRSCFSSWT
jgi:hypothetical protein